MEGIEERYEKKRGAEQFSRWSEKADSYMGLPILDIENKGWLIPKKNSKKKQRMSEEKGDITECSNENGEIKNMLSKKEQRRIKELKKKELLKKKRNSSNSSSKPKLYTNEPCVNQDLKIGKPKDIAIICELIMSDPEANITYLTYLLEYCEKEWRCLSRESYKCNFPIELAILSLVLVVKDITPGYKISNQIIGMEIAGNEQKVSLKKQTQRIHSYEKKIIDVYKRTCLLLKKMVERGKRINQETIIKAAMNLLDSTYHFNHHIILLRMILLYLMSSSDKSNSLCLSFCCEGLKNILNNDTTLEIGVESVNIINEVLFKRKGVAGTKKNRKSNYNLNKWILYPFIHYTPWNRVEESKSEYRRMFGTKKNINISQELIDELQQTSATRIKYETLIEREEIILKHLFTFYAKVLIIDLNDDLEQVFLGISHYSNRINQKIRSELISIIKGRLYKSESLSWAGFTVVLKCCFSLIQKGTNLTEHQLEDNSWILRYLIARLEKERAKINKIAQETLTSTKSSCYLNDIANDFSDPELPTLLLNASIFSNSNSSYLYHLLFLIGKISLEFSKVNRFDASLSLIKLCGNIIIKYPKLRALLDQEGIPCSEFPIDSSLSSLKYQEISLYYVLNEIIDNPNSDPKLKLACNLLLSESSEVCVKKSAISNIKNLVHKGENADDMSLNTGSTNELKPFNFVMKLIKM